MIGSPAVVWWTEALLQRKRRNARIPDALGRGRGLVVTSGIFLLVSKLMQPDLGLFFRPDSRSAAA